jgi:hypothetical protein
MGREVRVLVACEFSGVVREAFRLRGHDAWSCDLKQGEGDTRFHYRGNVRAILGSGWDLMIAHPECTYLCRSGIRWLKTQPGRKKLQDEAAEFFMEMINAPIPRIAVENPIGVMSTRYRKPDQITQPWWFGAGEVKATCLWLKGLPPLVPTDIVGGREARVHRMPPGPNRSAERSRTLPGIAAAMAAQWGIDALLAGRDDA